MQSRPALKSDLDCLLALNREYIRSVQASDVSRFQRILAGFLKYSAASLKISNLEAHDVEVRLMGDFAIIHARTLTPCRPGGKDTTATRMYGRGATAYGSPSRLM